MWEQWTKAISTTEALFTTGVYFCRILINSLMIYILICIGISKVEAVTMMYQTTTYSNSSVVNVYADFIGRIRVFFIHFQYSSFLMSTGRRNWCKCKVAMNFLPLVCQAMLPVKLFRM